jgi:hypothetical protein
LLVDLVSPWMTAVESGDPSARSTFLAQHASLLDDLRRQRAPDHPALHFTTDTRLLRLLMRHAVPAAARQRIADAQERVAARGADHPFDVALMAGDARGDIVEPLPWNTSPVVAIFLEHAGTGAHAVSRIAAAIARGAALVTRWRAPDSASVLARPRTTWDRWEISRDVPLAEWMYADGMATHAAFAADPSLAPHTLLGVGRGIFARLREAERTLRLLLDRDLMRPGLGPRLGWMVRAAAPAARTIDGFVIPPSAGRYRAWRMTEPRVQSAGLAAALRAPL